MKKVGTQVELDLTKVLKMLDKVFVALKQQSKSWDEWLGIVKKALPTLGDVETMLDKVSGRLNQLKLTDEGATQAGKEEIEVRRAQIVVLRAVRDEYKKQTQETKKGQQAQDRHSKAIGRNLKQMALWAVGTATAYRLFMKVRREIEKTIEKLYGNTEAYKALTAATDKYKIALVSTIGTESEVIDLMDRMAVSVSQWADDLNKGIAGLKGFTVLLDEFTQVGTEGQEKWMDAFALLAGPVGVATLGAMRLATGFLDADGAAEAAAHALDVYNEAIGSYNKQVEKAADETEDLTDTTEGFGDAIDAIRKRVEDYNKALYQITERRFENMLQAQRDYNDGIVELELDRQRTIEDNAIEAARRLEDIQRDTARRMAAIEREYAKQIQASKKDYSKGMRRAAETLAEKLLDIERRYQDKLLDIERAYAHSMYDAISTRDATAALQAMRRRKEELTDAKRDRDRARSDAHSDYAKRIRDLRESLAEQKRIARQAYQDQLEALRRSLAEEEEDYQISLRRREEDAELSYSRSLSDLRQAFLDRLSAIQTQNTLERANARADYLLRENAYARHLARMAAIYQSYQTATTPSTPTFGTPSPGVQQFAQGGMMVVNQPTLAMFGEAGRELVIAQPLPAATQTHNIAGNVTHQINATISQSIAGMEGRIAGAVQQALAEVIH